MTQPPHGGTGSQRTQSSDDAGTTKTDLPPVHENGSRGSRAAADFGQTTMSGSPRQGSQGQQAPQAQQAQQAAQHSTQQGPAQSYGLSGSAFSRGPGERSAEPQDSTRSGAAPQSRGARNRGPRRARLQLRHISPLTVLKFSCVLAIALFFVWLIVVGVLYGVLDAAGVISKVNDTVVQLNGSGSKPPITAGIVFGGAAIIGVINIVLFVALTTIGSVIYNLCADLVGGIEITLSER
ncbi:MAG TPA: DUF3566 domain-containing protein [Jatrophihabitans sp.]|jgi:hypothetical protein